MSEESKKEIMQQIWKEVLQLPELPDSRESFFDLGGNSLTATFVIQMYQEKTGIEIEIDQFYESDTIEDFIKIKER